jgi:hypothetical protein
MDLCSSFWLRMHLELDLALRRDVHLQLAREGYCRVFFLPSLSKMRLLGDELRRLRETNTSHEDFKLLFGSLLRRHLHSLRCRTVRSGCCSTGERHEETHDSLKCDADEQHVYRYSNSGKSCAFKS